MQGFRKFALVVCLSTTIVFGAAASGAQKNHRAHHAGSLDDGIITTILNFFGITLESRVSIPPG